MSKIISSGSWGSNLQWEIYRSNVLPPAELCTAVLCVAILNQRIVLAQVERGWGMLGGHIEKGETIEQALVRELYEEGGYTAEQYRPFGYRKIIATQPHPHQQPGQYYPFPVSYIAYYLATTTQPVVPHSGPEVLASQSFAIEDIAGLNTIDQEVIKEGWELYQTELKNNGQTA